MIKMSHPDPNLQRVPFGKFFESRKQVLIAKKKLPIAGVSRWSSSAGIEDETEARHVVNNLWNTYVN